MDINLSTFGDRKADFIKLYEALGLPYRGESKDEMKFNLMKYGDKIAEEQLSHIKTVPVAKKATPKQKRPKVTEINDEGSVFKAKVEYVSDDEADDEEEVDGKSNKKGTSKARAKDNMKPIKTVHIKDDTKESKESKASKEEEKPSEGSVPVKLNWNQFITLKSKDHPNMTRKELMVKYSGKVWEDYKAQFKE